MKTKEIRLESIHPSENEYDDLIEILSELFKKEIYLPLIGEVGLKKKSLQNDIDDLLQAIRAGRIWYSKGQFKGQFNATLSRELRRFGAEWDRKHGSWKIPIHKAPLEIRQAIAASESAFEKKLTKIDSLLERLSPANIAEKLKVSQFFDTALWRATKKFETNVSKIAVAPKITQEQAEKISREYTENMKKYVKDFTETEIKKLRKDIQDRALKGQRYEGMIDEIQKSYGVSRNKAKFLARQETKLFMAKYTESRYQSVGIDEYEWDCVVGSPLHPVRPMHKRLDGTRQRFSKPPIVNEKGDRKNPGEDYGCRCKAIPIVRF